MMWKGIVNCGSICAAILLAAIPLEASAHRGTVFFHGIPVPGATVTAVRNGVQLTTVTDPQGTYSFRELADGNWTIQVEMPCFSPARRDLVITPNMAAAEWSLELLPLNAIKALAGGLQTAPAPSGGAAANGGAEAGQGKLYTGAGPAREPTRSPAVNAAPGFQRTEANLVAPKGLFDAAVPSGDSGSENQEFGALSEKASTELLVNGSVNNGATSPFAQSAAFGNNRVKKNKDLYNGSLAFALDNSALDARPFSVTGQDTPKPDYNRLQGFLSLGGPLKIPHLLQNGPNFFISYQWVRNRNASNQYGLMPTLAERNGDFSHTVNALGQAAQVIDPTTGLPFQNSVIPQDRISAQAKSLLNLYPLPNFTGLGHYNYQISTVGITHQDNLQMRLNKNLDLKNRIFGTLSLQNSRVDGQNIFGFLDKTDSSGLSSGMNWSHSFNPHWYMNLGYQFGWGTLRTMPFFENTQNISGAAGITGNNQQPLNWGPPNLAFASITSLSDGQHSFNRNLSNSFTSSLLWSHRTHSFSFGGDFRRLQLNYFSQQDPRGTFTFTGAATQAAVNGVPVSATGADLADFLLGIPDTSSIAFGNADKYLRSSSYDAYFSDDWRVSSGFTLNAGIRWEYTGPFTELRGRLVNLDITRGFMAASPVTASNPVGPLTGRDYSDSLVSPDRHGFEPRIGLAWRPLAASSLVVRAGYAVAYNSSVYQTIATQIMQQPPFSTTLSVQNSPTFPLTLANGFRTSPSSVANTFAVDPGFRLGYAQNWQLSVQRELPGAMIVNVTYLGIKGTHEPREFLPNTFPSGAVNPCPACPTGFVFLDSNGNSTREAGTVQLQRRLRSGFSASLQYTFSKSIDDGSLLLGRGQSGSLIAQNWLDLGAERALSSFDQRHLLRAQVQYTTGVGVRGGTLVDGWKGALYKDWTVLTQVVVGSGLPLTPVFLQAVGNTGVTGSIRPSLTGAPIDAAPAGLFLNPAAYAAPAPGTWGDAGRNSITGPSQFALYGSLARTFRLTDRNEIDVRVDAVNPLNHVTFPGWNTTVGSPQFGLPYGANPMRSLQTSVRARF